MAKIVLVVDDEPDIVDLTAGYLEEEGYEVRRAFGCSEAQGQLLDGVVLAVVSDFRMPDGTGVDLMRAAREKLGHPIPFVFYSAYADALQRGGASQAEYCEVIQKPASRKIIVDAVERAVSSARPLSRAHG